MDQVIRSPPISYPGVFFIHKKGRQNSHRECSSLAGSEGSGAATHNHAHVKRWADGQGNTHTGHVEYDTTTVPTDVQIGVTDVQEMAHEMNPIL